MLSRIWIVNHQVDVTEEVVVKVAAVEAEAEEEGDGNKKSFTSKHLYYYRCYHTVLTSYLLALYYSINHYVMHRLHCVLFYIYYLRTPISSTSSKSLTIYILLKAYFFQLSQDIAD